MLTPILRSVIPTVRVASIDLALPLYEGLGFTVSWQHQLEPQAPRLTSVVQGPTELFLTEHPVAPYGSVVHFMVEGLDHLVAYAASAGFEPSFGPENRPWGDREVYFTDVDGNVLRFGERIEREASPRAEGSVEIREAVVAEARELTLLALRSKASWGYPDSWLREWESELTISADYIRSNTVLVAEQLGVLSGVVGVGDEPDGPEIHHLWVSPESQGEGVGRLLLEHAIRVARRQGWRSLRILSDPNAVPFYSRFGAVQVDVVPAPVAGTARELPLLRLAVSA